MRLRPGEIIILAVALWLLAFGAYALGRHALDEETCIGSAIVTDATSTTTLAAGGCSRP